MNASNRDPEMAVMTLRDQFGLARSQGKRAKEAAESIGLSEGAAIAAHVGRHAHALKAMALRGPWFELLKALTYCGPLMALTRNESTVHEKTGVYQKLSTNGHVGLALGEDIDLRLFFDKWHAGFAVTETGSNPGSPAQTSLQFFDLHGKAVHKIFAREATDLSFWQAVVDTFGETSLRYEFEAPRLPTPFQPDAQIDAPGFADAWGNMKDAQEFFGLLRQFGVERQQGFRLVEGRFSQRVGTGALRAMLYEAAFDGTPIMVFVGSEGCIQIHTGPVKCIEPMDVKSRDAQAPVIKWLNILDPGFSLHLREDLIANVWVVEKPTEDGVVSSLEAFDLNGDLMAMFFGARKPGQPELPGWRDILRRLPRLQEVVA
jgi:putative hemin transport protein